MPAGGFPTAGGVTIPGNFPPEGAAGLPVGGAATPGVTGATVGGFPLLLGKLAAAYAWQQLRREAERGLRRGRQWW